MTNLNDIIGDSPQEMIIPENTYGIDINVDFDSYAVYYNAEFNAEFNTIVKAHICDFKRVKKHGVRALVICDDNVVYEVSIDKLSLPADEYNKIFAK